MKFSTTPQIITQDMVSALIPIRSLDSHKGNFGSLLNISGSRGMCGAAMMSTLAAMRIGAGITRLVTPESIAGVIAPHLMEAMTIPAPEDDDGILSIQSSIDIIVALKKSTSCLIGCGLSCNDDTSKIMSIVFNYSPCRVIIDADGLNSIVDNLTLLKNASSPPIITPHIGEMARLVSSSTQNVLDNKECIATEFSVKHNTIVVLKSHKTLIAFPNGELYENSTGNPGLAKGGSGDVLAGMIAGLSAQGLTAEASAICGVYLHGACADSLSERMSQYSILARDVIEEIPFVLKKIGR